MSNPNTRKIAAFVVLCFSKVTLKLTIIYVFCPPRLQFVTIEFLRAASIQSHPLALGGGVRQEYPHVFSRIVTL